MSTTTATCTSMYGFRPCALAPGHDGPHVAHITIADGTVLAADRWAEHLPGEPPVPSWANDANVWEPDFGCDQPVRSVNAQVEVEGYTLGIGTMQSLDGSLSDERLAFDTGDLEGRVLADPVAALRNIAAWAAETADKLEQEAGR